MPVNSVGFGPTLAALLEHQAFASGQTVDHYIQGAVAARLVADMSGRDDPQLDDLHNLLAETGVEVPEVLAGHAADQSVIADPRRLEAVARTGLLDSAPNPAFENIVRMAAEALGTQAAALTLLERDRVFLLGAIGLPDDVLTAREAPIGESLAEFAVESGHTLVVDDVKKHPALQSVPFVRDGKAGAYLGVPLVDADGYAVGSLSVWDSRPRHWRSGHVDTLQSFARLAWLRIFEP